MPRPKTTQGLRWVKPASGKGRHREVIRGDTAMSSSLHAPLVLAMLFPWMCLRWSHRRIRTLTWRQLDRWAAIDTTPALVGGPVADYLAEVPASLPTGWISLYRTFRNLRTTNTDVLLDVGCGSGRAALLAAVFPLQRVIGIDLDPEQIRKARQNQRSCRLTPRAELHFEVADALTYDIPSDVNIVYMYNPFRGAVFARFVEKLIDSLAQSPRRLRVVYRNPIEHELFIQTGRFRLVRRYRGLRPTTVWARMLSTHVYETCPDDPNRRQ